MSDNKETKQAWAPDRIWLQRGVGDDGSHTWCSDSQDEHEQAEYVRVDVQAPAVETRDDKMLLTARQVAAILEFICPDAVTIDWSHEQMDAEAIVGHGKAQDDDGNVSGPHLLAWDAEYPEEGCVNLDNATAENCAPAADAGAQEEREDFEAAMEKHGRMRPFTRWPSDDSYTDDRIEWARRGWLAALARASEAAAGEPVGALDMLRLAHKTLACAALTQIRDGERIWNEIGAFIDAAPQPASEQQPIPQVFIDNGDASRKAFGKTVFAGMSNSDDLWPVWLDGWLRASEQQAASGLSDDVRSRLEFYAACYCKSTSVTDREAGKAMYALLAAKGDCQ